VLVARWSQGLQLIKGMRASNGGQRAAARGLVRRERRGRSPSTLAGTALARSAQS
jgi:hypothetical protein